MWRDPSHSHHPHSRHPHSHHPHSQHPHSPPPSLPSQVHRAAKTEMLEAFKAAAKASRANSAGDGATEAAAVIEAVRPAEGFGLGAGPRPSPFMTVQKAPTKEVSVEIFEGPPRPRAYERSARGWKGPPHGPQGPHGPQSPSVDRRLLGSPQSPSSHPEPPPPSLPLPDVQ